MGYIALLLLTTVLGILVALAVETVLCGLRAAGRLLAGSRPHPHGGLDSQR